MPAIAQSLWIGNLLSTMEIMCIKSFLCNGYDYHLYAYNEIQNVPLGVKIMNANEILDRSEVFTYNNSSYSAISNRFRFELLYKKGGMWVDTDVVCVKKYLVSEPYLIISESNKKYNEEKIGASIIIFPKEDPILLEAIEICKRKKDDILKGEIVWGLGPQTIKYLVEKYNLQKYVKPWYFANSCSCHHVNSIIDPNFESNDGDKNVFVTYSKKISDLPNDTYFIHLWNEFWRRNCIDKNKKFPKESLFEEIKIQFM